MLSSFCGYKKLYLEGACTAGALLAGAACFGAGMGTFDGAGEGAFARLAAPAGFFTAGAGLLMPVGALSLAAGGRADDLLVAAAVSLAGA